MKPEQSINNSASLKPFKLAIGRYIKSQKALKGMEYTHICQELERLGIIYTPENLRNKVSRGMFSADLLVALLKVLEPEEDALKKIIELTVAK